jgi:hypothetical protein
VPVSLGVQLLTATATDPTGAQATASITVSGEAVGPATLRLHAVPGSGAAPLIVRWQVVNQTGRPLVGMELDPTDSGSFESPLPSLEGVRTTYAAPGLFTARIRATDDLGQVHTASTLVSVLDRAETDARLQAKWSGLRAALQAGAVEVALELLAPEMRSRYRQLLTLLGEHLAQIAQELPGMELVYVLEGRAKYAVRQTILYGGQWVTLTAFVYFFQDTTGAWILEGF